MQPPVHERQPNRQGFTHICEQKQGLQLEVGQRLHVPEDGIHGLRRVRRLADRRRRRELAAKGVAHPGHERVPCVGLKLVELFLVLGGSDAARVSVQILL